MEPAIFKFNGRQISLKIDRATPKLIIRLLRVPGHNFALNSEEGDCIEPLGEEHFSEPLEPGTMYTVLDLNDEPASPGRPQSGGEVTFVHKDESGRELVWKTNPQGLTFDRVASHFSVNVESMILLDSEGRSFKDAASLQLQNGMTYQVHRDPASHHRTSGAGYSQASSFHTPSSFQQLNNGHQEKSVNTEQTDPYCINEPDEEQKQEAATQTHEKTCEELMLFEQNPAVEVEIATDENLHELPTDHLFLYAAATTSVVLKLVCRVAKSMPDLSLKSYRIPKEEFGLLQHHDSVHGALYEIASSITSFYHQSNQAMQTVHIELSSMLTSLQDVVYDMLNIADASSVTLPAYKTNTTAHINSCSTVLKQMSDPLVKVNTLCSDLLNVVDTALEITKKSKDECPNPIGNYTSKLGILNAQIQKYNGELKTATNIFLYCRQKYQEEDAFVKNPLSSSRKKTFSSHAEKKYTSSIFDQLEISKQKCIEVHEKLADLEREKASLEEGKLACGKISAKILHEHDALENFKKLITNLKKSVETIPKVTTSLEDCQSQLPHLFETLDRITHRSKGHTDLTKVVPAGVKFISATVKTVHISTLYTIAFEKIIKSHFEEALHILMAQQLPHPTISMEIFADKARNAKMDIRTAISNFIYSFGDDKNHLQNYTQELNNLFCL